MIDKIGKNKLDVAQNMDSMLSVVKEGIICGEIGVRYMHDITEGGVLGAIWEASKATGKGIEISEESIPIKDVTREIADIIGIDPYRLISSGSMLIIAEDEKVSVINEELNKVGIKVTTIGKIIEQGIILDKNGEKSIIEPPEADELYRALSLHK